MLEKLKRLFKSDDSYILELQAEIIQKNYLIETLELMIHERDGIIVQLNQQHGLSFPIHQIQPFNNEVH